MTGWRVRTALALWIGCAIVVWNTIFDRVLIVAGDQYIEQASAAARASRPYERISDWMPAAQTRGLWLASSGAAAVLIVGVIVIAVWRTRTGHHAPGTKHS